MRAAIYARVSTNGQTTTNQLRELRDVASRHGWDVVGEYVDQGVRVPSAPARSSTG